MKKLLLTYAKKSLSLFMACLMLMTAWVFVAPQEAGAAPAYGMSAASYTAADFKVYYPSGNGSEYIQYSYPKNWYLDKTESIQDVGYKIGISIVYGNGETYRVAAFAPMWGHSTDNTEERDTKDRTLCDTVFNNYSYTFSGGDDSDYSGNKVILLYGKTSSSTVTLSGTPKGTGTWTFNANGPANNGNAYIAVTQKYNKPTCGDAKWEDNGTITDYNTHGKLSGDMIINVTIYDKSALNAAVNIGNAINVANNSNYASLERSGKWSTFTSALSTAKTTLTTREVTQSTIDTATNNLVNAYKALEFKADNSALKTAIAAAQAKIDEADYKAGKYTQATMDALTTALGNATSKSYSTTVNTYKAFDGTNGVSNAGLSANNEQTEINNLTKAINDALNALAPNSYRVTYKRTGETAFCYNSGYLTWGSTIPAITVPANSATVSAGDSKNHYVYTWSQAAPSGFINKNYEITEIANPVPCSGGAEADCVTSSVCTVCGQIYKPATGHVFDGNVVPAKDANGNVIAGKHWKKCTTCDVYGMNGVDGATEACSTTQTANCTTAAYCACGQVVTSALGHNFTGTPSKLSTGDFHDYKCSRCEVRGAVVNGKHEAGATEACVDANNDCTCDLCFNPVAHEYTENIVVPGAFYESKTCTTYAVYFKSCKCGEIGYDINVHPTFKDEAGGYAAHDFGDDKSPDEDSLKTPATCTAKAVYYYECWHCGENDPINTFEYGNPIDHTYAEIVLPNNSNLVSAATCTAKAVYKKACTCGAMIDEAFEYGGLEAHIFDEVKKDEAHLKEAATCTNDAEYWYDCRICDTAISEIPEADRVSFVDEGSMLPHDYSEKIVDEAHLKSPANCSSAAVYFYDCAACDANAKNDPAAQDKTFSYGEKGDHSFKGKVVALNNGKHEIYCEFCLTEKETYNCEYNYDAPAYAWADDYSACTVSFKCPVCEALDTQNMTVSSEIKEGDEATCMDMGYTTYTSTLTYNGKTYGDSQRIQDVAIAPNAHDWKWVSKTDATCNYGAFNSYVCLHNEEHKKDEPIADEPALGHSWKTTAELTSADFNWSDDNTTCSITFVCQNDSSHTETVKVDTTREAGVATCPDATNPQTGEVKYTATIKFNGNTYTDFKTVAGQYAAHNYQNWTILSGDEATCQKLAVETGYCSYEGCTATTRRETGELVNHVYPEKWTSDGKGNHTKTCTTCKEVAGEVSVLTEACVGGEWITDKAPVCGVNGEKHKECECGYVTETGTIDALVHTYETYVSDGNATCQKDGTKTAICIYCKTEKSTLPDEGSKLDHIYPNKWTPDGSGKHTRTCTTCKEADGEVSVLTEDCVAGDWIIDEDAKCEVNGSKHKECKCGYIMETEVIPALEHSYTNYVSDENATCQKDGTKTAVCDNNCGEKSTIPDEGSQLKHVFEKYTTNNDGTHTAICETCDPNVAEKATDTQKCIVDAERWVEEKAATCTTEGWEYLGCAICGYRTEERAIPMLGHKYDKTGGPVEVIGATCTSDGYEVYKCKACDQTRAFRVPGTKLPHVASENPTYTSAGEGAHYTICATCSEARIFEKCTAGEWVDDANNVPTCDKAGLQYKYCKVCNAQLERQEVPASGHDYTKVVIDEAHLVSGATCTEKAIYKYGCTKCDSISPDKMFENGEVAADNHDFTAKVVKEETLKSDATCMAAAVYYYSCSRCGAVNKDDTKTFTAGAINPNNHKKTGEGTFTAPVETSEGVWELGYYTYKCELNDEHTVIEYVARADYKAYKENLGILEGHKKNEGDLTDAAKAIVDAAIAEAKKLAQNLIEDEQPQVDAAVEAMKAEIAKLDELAEKDELYTKKTCTITFNFIDENKEDVTITVPKDSASADVAIPENSAAKNLEAGKHETYKWKAFESNTITENLTINEEAVEGECTGGEATCEEAAVCEICNTAYGTSDPTKHVAKTPATCIAKAICSVCELEYGEFDENNHLNLGEFKSNDDATCQANGTKTATCADCNKDVTETDVGSIKPHEYGDAVPSTTKYNYHVQTCTTCQGDDKATLETKCTSDGGEKTTVIATCQAPGSETIVTKCKVCKDEISTVTNVLPQLDHSCTNYSDYEEATCQKNATEIAECNYKCGYTRILEKDNTMLAHSYGDAVSNGDGTHTRTCTTCVEDAENNITAAKVTENCYGGVATCEDKAVCSVCKTAYGNVNTGLEGHDAVLVPQVDPTCSSEGTKEHWTCTICNKLGVEVDGVMTEVQAEDLVIAKTSHTYGEASYSWADDFSACTATRTCTGCEDKITINLTITFEITDKPTCTEEGTKVYTATGKFEADNKEVTTTETEILAALDHDFAEDITPIEGKRGYHSAKCVRCDERTEATRCYGGEAKCNAYAVCDGCGAEYGTFTDHVNSEFEVIKEATCQAEGIQKSVCKFCGGNEKKEIIYKIPHVGETKPGVAATCTKAGYSEYVDCKFCGTNLEPSVAIPALGHIDSNADGKCDRCGEQISAGDLGGGSCGCVCHKQNGLMKFIYSILRFFWKLFGMSQTCDCGAVHY